MAKINHFKYFKTSPEIIKCAVMYYIRYPLSLRQVEDILHERGIDICHETIRYWWNKFGSLFSRGMKKKNSHPYSKWRWHIDEVFVKINGETHYLWRAVDHEGAVIDCYVSKRRDTRAAKHFLKKMVKKHGIPKQIVTDKLGSYRAALRALNMPHLHSTRQYENNQAENSHLHFRRREKMMNKFRSMRSLQKFTSFHAAFFNHFRPDVFISGSAIGWYGIHDVQSFTESDGPANNAGGKFTKEVCHELERESLKAEKLGIRTVLLRTGIVLEKDGGTLAELLFPFDFGVGGPLGNGKQWFSWIHRKDIIGLIFFAIQNPHISGPLNGTAPEPVTNKAFSQELGRAMKRPSFLPLPEFVLTLVFGEMAEEVMLNGQKVIPEKALNSGYKFAYPTLSKALSDIFQI